MISPDLLTYHFLAKLSYRKSNDYWPLEEKTLVGKEAVSDNNVIGRHTSPASVTIKGDVRYV